VQTPRKREDRKKKKKEMVSGNKLRFLSVYTSHIHGRDAETKLKQPQNGLFDHWN
jgi:hypothetical protein